MLKYFCGAPKKTYLRKHLTHEYFHTQHFPIYSKSLQSAALCFLIFVAETNPYSLNSKFLLDILASTSYSKCNIIINRFVVHILSVPCFNNKPVMLFAITYHAAFT